MKGLAIKNESERQRKVKLSPEGLANSKCHFVNGFSHSAMAHTYTRTLQLSDSVNIQNLLSRDQKSYRARRGSNLRAN